MNFATHICVDMKSATASLREAMRLRQKGFEPDVIIDIQGSGIRYILRDLAKSKFGYFEWFYRSRGADVSFGAIKF